MTRHEHIDIDAHEVHPGVWVGSQPKRGGLLAAEGFTHLVLCADSYQHPAESWPGVTVVHCPFEDAEILVGGSTLALLFATARAIAEATKSGACVLVTCLAGINRSALVAALAIRMLGVEPWAAVARVKGNRYAHCLSNETFLRIALGTNQAANFYLPAPAREVRP